MSRVSLITGGTRGLGYAIARALAQVGDHVIIAGRNPRAAQDVAEKLNAEGLDASSVALDVDSPESVKAAAETIGQRCGHVDVLVNNAGILPEATDHQSHEFAGIAMFEQTFRTNVFGVVAVLEEFLPLVRAAPAGRIVNVSTTMGSLADQSNPDSPYYSMIVPAYQSSKAALNSITVGLAKKLADTPIKVTAVCPGFVQTDLTPINKQQAPLTPDEAVAPIVTAASLAADAPTGTFVDREGTVAW